MGDQDEVKAAQDNVFSIPLTESFKESARTLIAVVRDIYQANEPIGPSGLETTPQPSVVLYFSSPEKCRNAATSFKLLQSSDEDYVRRKLNEFNTISHRLSRYQAEILQDWWQALEKILLSFTEADPRETFRKSIQQLKLAYERFCSDFGNFPKHALDQETLRTRFREIHEVIVCLETSAPALEESDRDFRNNLANTISWIAGLAKEMNQKPRGKSRLSAIHSNAEKALRDLNKLLADRRSKPNESTISPIWNLIDDCLNNCPKQLPPTPPSSQSRGEGRELRVPLSCFVGGSLWRLARDIAEINVPDYVTHDVPCQIRELAMLHQEIFTSNAPSAIQLLLESEEDIERDPFSVDFHKARNDFNTHILQSVTVQPKHSSPLPIPSSVAISSPGKADKPSSESSDVILVTVEGPMNVTVQGRTGLPLQSKRLLASMACFANLQDSYHVFDKNEAMSLYDPHNKANLSNKEVSTLFARLSSDGIVSDERKSGKRGGTQKKVTFSRLKFRIETKEDLKTLLQKTNPPIPQRRKKKS